MDSPLELEERRCINPKCLKPFKVNINDTKTLYHSVFCQRTHEGKEANWNHINTDVQTLPKEVRDWINSTPIPVIH